MDALRYAKERIKAALEETARLRDSDFPHSHPKDALDIIKGTLLARQGALDSLTPSNQPEVILAACTEALVELFALHPYMGFILRSTNVRNSFEVYRPVLNLAKAILGPNIKLLLSSEWQYSPFVMRLSDELPGFVLMGLPACESGNPLLVPLAGHELGHTTWQLLKLESKFSKTLMEAMFENIENRWPEFERIFDPVRRSDLRGNLFVNNTLAPFHTSSLLQAEETFCDFLGLRIFAESYFYAYAYLVSPGTSFERSFEYPKQLTRIKNMLFSAGEYGFSEFVPKEFKLLFLDDVDLSDRDQNLLISIADYAVEKIVKGLSQEADRIATEAGIPGRSKDNIQRSYECFKMLVPTSRTKSLADIINAGCMAYHDDNLWSDKEELEDKRLILFDVILKSIEVLEIEAILGAD